MNRTSSMTIHWLEQTESDVPPDNEFLNAREIVHLNTLRVPKRHADWLLGRWTAKRAVAAVLGLPMDTIEIRAASSGAPEVFVHYEPAPIPISLSHSAGTALCSTAPLGIQLGCDLETIEPRSDAFIADYFTVDEQALIERCSMDHRPLLIALLWSGKESALKALREGLRLDTRSVSVQPGSWIQSPFHANIWRPLQAHCESGQVFKGWWRAQNKLVRTIVSDVPNAPPVETLLATSLPPQAISPPERQSLRGHRVI